MTAPPEFGAAIEELRKLIAKATQDDLSDDGRYFHESCDDLTQCRHSEVGEYQNSHDGKLVEWLWNRRNEILSLYTSTALPLAHPAAPQGEQEEDLAKASKLADRLDDWSESYSAPDALGRVLLIDAAMTIRELLAALAPAANASGREGAE